MSCYEPQQQIAVPEMGGSLEYAYFVLSGQCMILQCLKVLKKMRGKRECYRLLPPDSASNKLRIAERLMKRKDSTVLESVLSPSLRASLMSVSSQNGSNGAEDGVKEKEDEQEELEGLQVQCDIIFDAMILEFSCFLFRPHQNWNITSSMWDRTAADRCSDWAR